MKKINNEIDEFTNSIKADDGHDKLFEYVNSSLYSCVKLLMFASKTFGRIGRVMLFFIIALTGLFAASIVGVFLVRSSYVLAIDLILFISMLYYILHYKTYLVRSIENSKNKMSKDDES